MKRNQAPPKDLSRQARGIWRELTSTHDFEPHELVTFRRALRWWDVADGFESSAMAVDGKERAALLKLSIDASNAALRCWRTLKFPSPDGVRRPGRPSDGQWSAKRKAALSA